MVEKGSLEAKLRDLEAAWAVEVGVDVPLAPMPISDKAEKPTEAGTSRTRIS